MRTSFPWELMPRDRFNSQQARRATAASPSSEADVNAATAAARGEGQGVSFIHDVVGALGEGQPDGVTLPFFFTCVLHLANEKGLLLEGGEGGDLSDIFIRPATKENAL